VLVWTDQSADEEGFTIYQNGTVVATVPADTTQWPGPGVVNCGDSLVVSAFNANGESPSAPYHWC
jgi:hypothetical protein